MNNQSMTEDISKSSQALLKRILAKYGDSITGPDDLTGGEAPSPLFYLLADRFSYLLSEDSIRAINSRNIRIRRWIHPLIMLLGPKFLKNPQVFENRNALLHPDQEPTPDSGVQLPDEPVIFIANHAFLDDVLATTLAARKHSYVLLGSLPQFYNTLDGITAWLNGIILVNRKVRQNKATIIERVTKLLKLGTDIIIFPEGVWNKTPNQLMLDLWPGVYRIAVRTGAKVVPIVHYVRDCTNQLAENPIHTVIDDPMRIDHLSEAEALQAIRDRLAGWFYLLMERYGQSTRAEELAGFSSMQEAWEHELIGRVKTTDRYDRSIEFYADYRPRQIVRPEDVFAPIAVLQSPAAIQHAQWARQFVEERAIQDFQRRF